MGSVDWAKCAYCEYWVKQPYLYDPDGHALCGWCENYLLEGGSPNSANHWWSTIQTTSATLINLRLLPQHGLEIVQHIATFLVDKAEPNTVCETLVNRLVNTLLANTVCETLRREILCSR